MKNAFTVIPLGFLLCFMVACQQGERALVEPKEDAEADIQAIKDVVAELNAAVNAADIDTSMAIYADDAVRIRPNEPAAVGKEAIQRGAQQFFDMMTEYTFEEKYVVEDVKSGGNLAVAHLTWSGIYTPKSDGEPVRHNGNWIMAFKKLSDGSWKLTYSIWSDEKLINPDQPE